ncbi:hypothetical protein AMELA_G00131630, partial [Ameiurus melas]
MSQSCPVSPLERGTGRVKPDELLTDRSTAQTVTKPNVCENTFKNVLSVRFEETRDTHTHTHARTHARTHAHADDTDMSLASSVMK